MKIGTMKIKIVKMAVSSKNDIYAIVNLATNNQ